MCPRLSFIGLLIYASVIYHKHRKGTLMEEVAVYEYPTATYASQHLIPDNNSLPPVMPYRGGYSPPSAQHGEDVKLTA